MLETQIVHIPRRFVAHEWGGTESVVLEISKCQKSMGGNPVIMTSMALAVSKSEEIGEVPVFRFQHLYPFFGLSSEQKLAMDKKGGNLLSLPLLWALFRKKHVRIFHAHTLKRLGGIVRTVARWKKKPYVVSLHGGVFDVPKEELNDLIKPIRGKLEWGKIFGALLGARRVLEDADHVICVGENEAKQARKALSHDRVSYLQNGVDSQRFQTGDGAAFRKQYRISEEAFLVVNISRIDKQKNQLSLLKGFSKFYAENNSARLLLIGPETQPSYAAELRAYIHENGLSEAVTMIAGLNHDEDNLVNAYHAADVFALASRHEPFGIVVLEAWCAACPVVVSRVGGLQSLVRDEQTGLFFDPSAEDATEQIATHFFDLARDPARRHRLGKAGQKEVLEKYDWSVVSARLEEIYQQAEVHAAKRYGRAYE